MYMYRGREGFAAWLLHRVTGVGVVLFLALHIADTALVGLGPGLYNEFVRFYASAFGRIMEVFLAAALIFHAFNGIRVMIINLVSGSTEKQGQMFWAVFGLSVVVVIPMIYIMLKPLFGA
jgi:succinate dehydrogenase / fumarate reductase, cytochrome b subunit